MLTNTSSPSGRTHVRRGRRSIAVEIGVASRTVPATVPSVRHTLPDAAVKTRLLSTLVSKLGLRQSNPGTTVSTRTVPVLLRRLHEDCV
jgi:hypothetical protein